MAPVTDLEGGVEAVDLVLTEPEYLDDAVWSYTFFPPVIANLLPPSIPEKVPFIGGLPIPKKLFGLHVFSIFLAAILKCVQAICMAILKCKMAIANCKAAICAPIIKCKAAICAPYIKCKALIEIKLCVPILNVICPPIIKCKLSLKNCLLACLAKIPCLGPCLLACECGHPCRMYPCGPSLPMPPGCVCIFPLKICGLGLSCPLFCFSCGKKHCIKMPKDEQNWWLNPPKSETGELIQTMIKNQTLIAAANNEDLEALIQNLHKKIKELQDSNKSYEGKIAPTEGDPEEDIAIKGA